MYKDLKSEENFKSTELSYHVVNYYCEKLCNRNNVQVFEYEF